MLGHCEVVRSCPFLSDLRFKAAGRPQIQLTAKVDSKPVKGPGHLTGRAGDQRAREIALPRLRGETSDRRSRG